MIMKVAFGKVSITPDDYIGRCLAGYTPIPRCTGKYDDIYARGVLIENIIAGNIPKRILFISLDLLQLPLKFSMYVKEKLEKAFQIHPDQVLVHATHTHKSLDMSGLYLKPGGNGSVIWAIMFGQGDDRYKVWVAKRVVNMVGEMIGRLEPARMSWIKQALDTDIVVNRRHPSRHSRPKLGVISFLREESADMIGIVGNYGMHPTTLSRFVSKLSADYPGRFVHEIEQMTNGKVSAVFFTAPAGDLNPITTCGTDFEALERDPHPLYEQEGTYADTKRFGKVLAESALQLASAIPEEEYYSHFDIQSRVRSFSIPLNDFTRYWSKNRFSNTVVHWLKRRIAIPIRLAISDAHEPNFPGFAVKHTGMSNIVDYTQVSYMRFTAKAGDEKGLPLKTMSIAGVPGELFENFADRMYARTPEGPEGTFIIQNANDWVGYLFPLDEYKAGGYEPLVTFGPLCGTYVKNNYFKLIQDVERGLLASDF
jgi:hypothetical protein